MGPEENVNIQDKTELVEDKEVKTEQEEVKSEDKQTELLKKLSVDFILDYKNSKTSYSMDSINLTYLGWIITITHKLIKDISDDLIARLDQNDEKINYPKTEDEKKNLRRLTINFVFDENHKRGSYSIDEKMTMVEKICINKFQNDLMLELSNFSKKASTRITNIIKNARKEYLIKIGKSLFILLFYTSQFF